MGGRDFRLSERLILTDQGSLFGRFALEAGRLLPLGQNVNVYVYEVTVNANVKTVSVVVSVVVSVTVAVSVVDAV